ISRRTFCHGRPEVRCEDIAGLQRTIVFTKASLPPLAPTFLSRYRAHMPFDRLDLGDRVCLITGAGRGIGLTTAAELLARQARGVVLVALPGDELEAAAGGLGERAVAVGADVSDGDAMMVGAVAAAREQFGALDVVVANAGIERIGTVRRQPPEEF